ncbi:NADH dehydrogenase [ubiquinone] 1 alpha subcomplex subunit 6-like [Cydia pomonella]|uniref:NADH dehydrogenase [ubiquinone] 1 alpha subcomplex subunit 6-like n=1 Tax=Cydia pomonella TaxID=82600 RepID=UPI002ADE89BB|nr:NADH dehydrogenase [ubiquinone] 1 alpha subcomplex subunit 6-like [Cydia pomonella]
MILISPIRQPERQFFHDISQNDVLVAIILSIIISEILLEKMAQKSYQAAFKRVRPLMSTDCFEARRRVISLYKAVYRYIPWIVKYYDIPKNENDVRLKVRELFYKNACVTDVRVIDLLVIKGWMEFMELRHNWQMKGRLFAYWNPTIEPKPCDFLNKFLAGIET